MKAIAIRQHGGPDVLSYEDVEVPQLSGGDVLIQVAAAGVNFIDTYHRAGVYPVDLPMILGQEGAGTVVEIGRDVTGIAIGDRVAWAMNGGSYAEFAAVPASKVVNVPAEVSLETAAAVMLQGMTAHYLVKSTYAVKPGDVAVVHAAAGGVGQLLLQLIKAAGGISIGVTSSPEKAAVAQAAGADHLANYENFVDVTAAVSGGRGAHVVYDGVGKSTFDASLSALRPRGMMVLFGGSSGQVPPFEIQRLNAGGSLFLTRPSLAHYIADRGEYEWRAEELFAGIASKSLHVNIGATFALSEAAAAHTALEGRATTGKVVLKI